MIKRNIGGTGFAYRLTQVAARSLATLTALTFAAGLASAQSNLGTPANTPGPVTQAENAAGAATAGASEPERVIVTGSFIPTAESEGALPVTVESAAQFIKGGAQTPAEGLRQLPSFIGATATENDSNGGNGAAFVNLRGLGAGNTLTLINGRRAFYFSDINALGIGAINRVEILKDGASAIYGSDAVAGVVNYVLLNGPGAPKYTGGEVDFLYGNTTEKDAHVIQTFVNTGYTSKDGRFSAVFSFTYYDRQAIYSRDRFELAGNADQRALGGNNGLSGSLPGRFTVTGVTPGGTRILDNNTLFVTGTAGTHPFSVSGGDGFNFRAFTPAIPEQEKFYYYGAFSYKLFNNNSAILYGDMMYAETRQDNGLAPSPISQFSAGNLNGRPIPNTGTPGRVTNGRQLIDSSPFNPFGAALSSFRYRLTGESGNRRDGFDQKFYRFEGGLKGDFNFKGQILGSANYDFGVVYEQYKQVETDNGDATFTSLLAQYLPFNTASQEALSSLVSGNRLAQAQNLNRQFGGTFNPFRGLNAPVTGTVPIYTNGVQTGTRTFDNVAAVNRALYTANNITFNTAQLYDLRVGGTFMPNWKQGGFSIVGGAEYRTENQSLKPDPVQGPDPVTGFQDPLGFNSANPFNYKRNTFSVFAEASIPVITPTMKVPGVFALDFTVAIRYEQYENIGQDPQLVDQITGAPIGPIVTVRGNNGGTPRYTMRWQPYSDLTIRASYGKSYAQPSFGQLFLPNSQNFPVISDPLTGTTTQPSSGVFQKGNIDLLPEKSDTWTAGLVFTPKQVKGLTLTVDWYQIHTNSLVVGPASQAQIFATLNGLTNGRLFAINATQAANGVFGVYRDPLDTTGQITQINAGFGNSGSRFVEGIDMQAIYNLPTNSFGTFTFTFGYNHFFYYNIDSGAGVGPTRFAGGNYASLPLVPGAIPYNKGFLRTEWDYRGWYFGATVNYVGDYHNDGSFLANGTNTTTNTDLANPQYFYSRKSGTYVTLDLQLSYSFKAPKAVDPVYAKDAKGVRTQVAASQAVTGNIWQRLLWGTTIRTGVNNVFDKYPPYDAAAFNDNYDTSTYSIRNRFWYIGVNKKF